MEKQGISSLFDRKNTENLAFVVINSLSIKSRLIKNQSQTGQEFQSNVMS
jgi:hypothetical protein